MSFGIDWLASVGVRGGSVLLRGRGGGLVDRAVAAMRCAGRGGAIALGVGGAWVMTCGLLSFGVASSAASGWSSEVLPSPSVPNGQLVAVSCPASRSCVAVGNFTDPAEVQTLLVEGWNGRSWSVMTMRTPSGATGSGLSGVSCTSSRACVAVGSSTTASGVGVTLAEVWDGRSWTVQRTANPSGARSSTLVGVSCTTRGFCIAVGSFTDRGGARVPLVERLSGSRWSIRQTPKPGGAKDSSLAGVSCTSASACTAVGSASQGGPFGPLVERWNGTRWSIQRTPIGGVLNGVSCVSTNACIAVGSVATLTLAAPGLTLAERWNGSRWSITRTKNPPPSQVGGGSSLSALNAVSCTSANACVAVGSWTASSGWCSSSYCHVTVTVVQRWDGTRWSMPAARPPKYFDNSVATFSGVSCTSRAACTAVGAQSEYAYVAPWTTLAERWNGSTWTVQSTPSQLGASPADSDLTAVSCASATACTAVGSYPKGGLASGSAPFAEAWDGSTWTSQNMPTPSGAASASLSGVSCASATACTAVGSYSTGYYQPPFPFAEGWNGSAWTIQNTPTPANAALNAVSCTSATACTAVGSYSGAGGGALAEAWDGSTWTSQNMPTPSGVLFAVMSGVSCASARACTALGWSNGVTGRPPFVEAWDGSTWTIQNTPTPANAGRQRCVMRVCDSLHRRRLQRNRSARGGLGWLHLDDPEPARPVRRGLRRAERRVMHLCDSLHRRRERLHE